MFTLLKEFRAGWHEGGHRKDIKEDKAQRDNLSEKQIDASIQDSFPASDSASKY